jgi:oligopeptide transport system substrate-binding protein
MRRRPVAIGLSFLMLAACSGSRGEQFKKAPAGATAGGKLVIGITPPGSLEPSNAFDPMGQLVIRTMCDSLIGLDPVTGALRPAIAESWNVVQDGFAFTLKLRKGVRFSNGEELTADDVAFSLSRIADREYASSVAELIRPIEGFEFMHGEQDTDNDELLKSLAGVVITETYGVAIVLRERRADFLRLLTHPLASPIPKETVLKDPTAFERRPVCAGPYRMKEPWNPTKNAINLERFDGYYGNNLAYTRGGRGYPDEIQFRIDTDPSASFSAQRVGNSDLAQVPPARIGEARPDPGFFQVPSPMLEYIGLPSAEPFNRPEVRRAMSEALDRTALVNAAFGGGRLPATGILPPTVGDVYKKDACGAAVAAGSSVPLARSELQKAGVDLKGRPLKIYFNDEFSNRRIVETVAAQWKVAFGLNVEVIAMPWNDYIARANGQPAFDGAFRMSWAAEYPSPDRYLFPLFHTDSIGEQNFTRFSNVSFDRLLERSARRATAERDLRVEYRRLETLACRSMPIVPLTFGAKEYVASPKVGSAIGTLGDVTNGQPAVRELFVKSQ